MGELKTGGRQKASLLYDPKIRSLAYQAIVCLIIGILIWLAASNAATNLQRAKIAVGFAFWNQVAGFSIDQSIIPYTAMSTYGRAFWVGLLNTLIVAALGIVFATIIGFAVGVMQLSRNYIVSHLATGYVQLFRNIPLLLQLFFWYNAVLKALPAELRNSLRFPGGGFLNNRGLFLPRPIVEPGFSYVVLIFVFSVITSILWQRAARVRQIESGKQFPVLLVSVTLVVGLSTIAFWALGRPLHLSYPVLGRFNIDGGLELLPEFIALLVGLSIYTAAFIAEVVRAGISAVSRGQTEASSSLGLGSILTLRLVVIPQAMRVIIPPLTSQYLSLTKNSSLAVAIGYPDLVQVFAGTVLSQTGQAVEVIVITMSVYLSISIVTSTFMSWYGGRIPAVER